MIIYLIIIPSISDNDNVNNLFGNDAISVAFLVILTSKIGSPLFISDIANDGLIQSDI